VKGATIEKTIITIPGTPAYALSPNSRVHWRVKHKETAQAKHDTAYAIRYHEAEPIHGPVTIHWGIYLARRRRFMDRDNAIATLKPHMDQLVASGIIDADTPDIVIDIKITQFLYNVDHTVEAGEIDVVITPAQGRRGEEAR
jgi:hypothetical protein